MQHRRLQRHHSIGAKSAIFGVAFNPITSKWSAVREAGQGQVVLLSGSYPSTPRNQKLVRLVADTTPRSGVV
jgi:hypothetical protein